MLRPRRPKYMVYKLLKDWSDRKAGEVILAEEMGDGAIFRDLIDGGFITEGDR
jgi:hypothetical protein